MNFAFLKMLTLSSWQLTTQALVNELTCNEEEILLQYKTEIRLECL